MGHHLCEQVSKSLKARQHEMATFAEKVFAVLDFPLIKLDRVAN
jgi:hypothetical protein